MKAKRKGVVVRRGLKEERSKRTSRWTRTGYEAYGARTSWQMTTKSIFIKSTGCKSGGCVRKAVELTSGDQHFRSLIRPLLTSAVRSGSITRPSVSTPRQTADLPR